VTQDFDIYKLLVEEVREARKARRDLANIFTTLNLGGVGALGVLARPGSGLPAALLLWAGGALVLVCVIWRISNSYYSTMLKIKYDIIYDYEDKIGIDPLRREWKGLPRRGPPKWFSLERAMPLLFILGYLVFLAYRISWSEWEALGHLIADPIAGVIDAARRRLA
jgi:hypothetical protein